MDVNRHMNLFEHYRQEGESPHENNLSRGLAILLDENPLLLERFIDLANSKLLALRKDPIRKPEKREDREIGFQQGIKKLCDEVSQRIIGFTLTPDLPRTTTVETQETQPVHENLVTDIAISCGEDLLIVEVKKVPGSSAEAQVTAQAESAQFLSKKDAEIVSPLRLTWEDIVRVLQNIDCLQGGNRDPILRHYLEYLETHHQEWFAGAASIRRRMKSLADNCLRILSPGRDPDEEEVYWDGQGFVVPLKTTGDYAREFHLCPREEESQFTEIQVALWLGNNLGQSRALFEAREIRDDMSWTLEKSIEVDKTVLETAITPYLKFSHIMGRFVMDAYVSPGCIGSHRPDIRKKFFVPLARSWRREEWPELLNLLTEKNSVVLEDPAVFRANFRKNFEESDRSFAVVVPGYEAIIKIPAGMLPEHQAPDSGKGCDKTASLVVDAIKAIIKRVEVLPGA